MEVHYLGFSLAKIGHTGIDLRLVFQPLDDHGDHQYPIQGHILPIFHRHIQRGSRAHVAVIEEIYQLDTPYLFHGHPRKFLLNLLVFVMLPQLFYLPLHLSSFLLRTKLLFLLVSFLCLLFFLFIFIFFILGGAFSAPTLHGCLFLFLHFFFSLALLGLLLFLFLVLNGRALSWGGKGVGVM